MLTTEGGVWRLHLSAATRTTEHATSRLLLEEATLRLTVSADEENVDAELVWGSKVVSLQPSVHWYIVLHLARARQADAAEGEQPEREQGWIYRDDLCQQLQLGRTKLNVDLHRLRQYLSRAGVVDGADLIERRPSSGQLRLGTGRFELR